MEVMVRGKPVTLDHVADLEPTGRAGTRGPFYRVTLNGEEIVGSAVVATFDACRVLQERGLSGRIGFRHRDGMIGLVTTIEAGAKLSVSENARGTRFTEWSPWSPDAIAGVREAP